MEFAAIFILIAVVFFLSLMIKIVPQQNAYIIERLGKYDRTIEAGFSIIIPFYERIAYRNSLKEMVLDIPPQICITKDNVQVNIDGVIFYRVIDPKSASYGVNNFEMAIIQLAQTTLRSEIGKLDLDRTFEEREKINNALIMALDAATQAWGVKVLRYEIKAIVPPKDVLDAMEKQMRAEREKRAHVLTSEGTRDSLINNAEGRKQELIKNSEAQKQRQINEAEGQAEAILAVAKATSEGIRLVAQSLSAQGGHEAASLKIAEEYVKQLGNMATNSNLMVVPANVSDPAAIVTTAFAALGKMTDRLTPTNK
ncbi:MAG: paraslipin [Bdellovibrionaceae bacterium]|nr:paraslipin [Pseudobdellovibrionaceae bacterium]